MFVVLMVHAVSVSFPVNGEQPPPEGADRVVFLGYQAGGSNQPELNRHQPHQDINTKNMPERDIATVGRRTALPKEAPR